MGSDLYLEYQRGAKWMLDDLEKEHNKLKLQLATLLDCIEDLKKASSVVGGRYVVEGWAFGRVVEEANRIEGVDNE